MVVSSLVIPRYYGISYPKGPGPIFDPDIKLADAFYIGKNRPRIVLLGNSLLMRGVDRGTLQRSLGVPVYHIGVQGSASALWYTVIKNNIVVVPGDKPDLLIIIFRDTTMTMPDYRVQGSYFEQLDEYTAPGDELLIQRAFVNRMNLLDKLAENYLPVYGSRFQVRNSLENRIRSSVVRPLFKCDLPCTDQAMYVVFSDDNMAEHYMEDTLASAETYLYSDYAYDFKARVNESFLPEMIRLCQENDIQLVLVRMKTLKYAYGDSEPPGLIQYTRDLSDYLQQNDVVFFDFNRDARLTGEHFYDLVHLNKSGKQVFTELLAEALAPLLQAK